jgi:hypothetical protein
MRPNRLTDGEKQSLWSRIKQIALTDVGALLPVFYPARSDRGLYCSSSLALLAAVVASGWKYRNSGAATTKRARQKGLVTRYGAFGVVSDSGRICL